MTKMARTLYLIFLSVIHFENGRTDGRTPGPNCPPPKSGQFGPGAQLALNLLDQIARGLVWLGNSEPILIEMSDDQVRGLAVWPTHSLVIRDKGEDSGKDRKKCHMSRMAWPKPLSD